VRTFLRTSGLLLTAFAGLLVISACAPSPAPPSPPDNTSRPSAAEPPSPTPTGTPLADVLSVTVSGEANNYRFAVEIRSPDTGCEQYADWWEVITEDGELIYRRILAHSHVDEQPFTRSGGPVPIGPESVVIVRAHMHPRGYGGTAMKGSVKDGFHPIRLGPDVAVHLEKEPPLPSGCAF